MLINHVVNGKAGNLVQKEDYQEITDSAWQDAVRDALDGEIRPCTGRSKAEFAKKRKDNVNRIWDMRQWTTSVYSSAYDTEYQNFRNNVFQVEQPFRNRADAVRLGQSAVSEIYGSQICDRTE